MQIEKADQPQNGQGEQARDRAIIQRAIELPAIPARDRSENAIDGLRKPPLLGAFQEDRAHHRRKRQRDHTRNDDRAGQRERKLPKQRTGKAAEESDWRIDRGERDRHRDHRADDLARTLHRCLHRRLALLEMAMNVFHDHDRIIDDQSDREHHRQQRQQIETETGHQHQATDADQ